MAVATLGMLDLSIVTEAIKSQLETCITNTPLFDVNGGPVTKFDIFVTGDPPDVVRSESHCNLSLFLFHVTQDKSQMNALNTNPGLPNPFPRSQAIPLQPMSLDLYYLLTAYSDGGWAEAQQAMGIALRCIHEHPIIVTTLPLGPANPEQFCITMEPHGIDEAARLWQATTAPIRLSSVYKASVVFLSPEAPPPPPPKVQRVQLLNGSQPGGFAATLLQLVGTSSTTVFLVPTGAQETYELSPAVAAAGQKVILFGNGLTGGTVSLAAAGGPAVDVSAWIQPASQTDRRLVVTLPAATGPAPGGTPPPGLYEFTVTAGGFESNATPISIAPRVDNVTNPPLLNAPGVLTIQGVGFAGADLYVGGAKLRSVAGAPAVGEYQVNAAGSQILFQVPASLGTGRHPVTIRANGVDAAPSWWVQV